MTFAASCGWSLVRSLVIAAVGLYLARHVQRFLDQQVSFRRTWGWCLLLIPFLCPGLVVGYGYRNYALSLVHYPMLNQALYGLILTFQAVPVGVALLHFAPPPPVSAEAAHCFRLSARIRRSGTGRDLWQLPGKLLTHVRFAFAGPLQSQFAAASLMFLVTFQEAEIAALMQAHGWTEWLFTRQAGLYDVRATLRYVALVVLLEAIFIVPVLIWVRQRLRIRGTWRQYGEQSVSSAWWLLLAGGVLVNAVIPAWFMLRGTFEGLAVVRQQPAFWRELAHGLVYAGVASTIGVCIAMLTVGARPEHGRIRMRTVVGWLLLVPGLCGSLTLGLVLSGLFQHSALRWAYDGPAGLIAGLTLYLLPRVVLVRSCLWSAHESSMTHTARLLRNSPRPLHQRTAQDLLWRFIGRPRFWGFVVVFFWAYLELTLADILAAPGLEPVVKRLYNLMHFGHISGLAAMVCVTLSAPLVLILAALTGRRVLFDWFSA